LGKITDFKQNYYDRPLTLYSVVIIRSNTTQFHEIYQNIELTISSSLCFLRCYHRLKTQYT